MGRPRFTQSYDENGNVLTTNAPASAPGQVVTNHDPTQIGDGQQVYVPADGGAHTPAGPSSADAERDHYRQIGDDMARRQAVQLNYGAADADRQNNLNARETQIEAGGMMRTAATGGAPSRAAIEGAQVGDNSLEAQLGASAGARGPAAAQQNAAATGAVGLQLQGADRAGLGRSAETNRALLAYGQNTGAMRKGDYTMQQLDQRQAEAQAQQQLNQNQRNQTGQMGMEQLGINTEQAQVNASNRLAGIQNKANQDTAESDLAHQKRTVDTYKGLSNMITSDERAKQKAALPGLAAKGRAMLEQQNANRDSLRYGSSVGKIDAGLAARGRAMLDQSDANRDSLRYGPSVQDRSVEDHVDQDDVDTIRGNQASAEDVDTIRFGQPNRGDVNRIKHGHDIDSAPPTDGEMQSAEHGLLPETRGGTSERGVGGVERGYAKMREGQMGGNVGMNGASYDLGTGYSDDPDKHYGSTGGNTYAPGTDDFYRYGKPRQVTRVRGDVDENDYIKGQAPTERVDAPMDDYSRAVSMSDANAKRAAFLDGVNATQQMHDTGVVPSQPEYMNESGSGQPRAAGVSPGGRAASSSALKPSRDAEAYREYLRRGDVREKRDKAFEVLETPQPGAFSSFSAAGQAGAGLEPHFRESNKPQQPGPTTTRPVPPPIKETGDFEKGLERQFGGPPKDEVPDERARRHLERSKLLGLAEHPTFEPGARPESPVRGRPPEPDSEEAPAMASTRRRMGSALGASVAYRTSDERAKTAASGDDHALQQDANRKLVGSTYVYKDGVGEDTSQVHHGQMAQTMEENPITATAVREGPDGYKRVSEFDKLNVTAAGVAELQREQDEMRAALAKLQARRQRRV